MDLISNRNVNFSEAPVENPKPVDITGFQLYPHLEGDDEEDTALLLKMGAEALRLLPRVHGVPPTKELYLGFGIGGIVAVFLAQLAGPLYDRPDTQIWAVVGDLPPAFIGIINPDPVWVLRAYCELMDDWADRVLAAKSLEGAYDVPADPTPELARMLKSRVEYLRDEIIPEAESVARGPI
jgi:hypothetical protein